MTEREWIESAMLFLLLCTGAGVFIWLLIEVVGRE
jgi:hypothetical protein